MQVEGLTTKFIADRLGITPLFAQQCISRPERFSQSKRELLCLTLNRSYDEVFGSIPVRPEIMIARPVQNHVQQIA